MASEQRWYLALYFVFQASLTFRRVKMYKTHIKQWGLDKKNKAPEMRAIVRKNKQRAEQGKGSIIRVRGQLRKFAEVVRCWSRKGKSIDEIVARQTASPTPEAVELFTPVPSPTLTPLDFAIPERLFRCIRNYFDSSFESGTWVRTDSLSLCHSIKGEGHTNLCVDDLLEQCELACGLFSTRLFAEAGRTLIAATTKIEKIVLGEDPLTLVQIFASIVTFHYEKRDEVALSILRQFSALGTMLLGNQHPLSRICEWMNLVHTSNFEELTIRCMESMVDQFERFVGPFHLSTMSSRVILITYAGWEGNAGIQMTEKLLGECEEKLQPYDFRISWVRRCLAIEYFNRSYYVEAKTLTQKDIACSQHFQSTDWEDSLNIYIVAMCQYALGEVESGIATLHKAINSIMSERGPQDGLGRQWLLQLETSYLEQGRWSSATEVRERRENILESIELTDSYFGPLR